MEPIEDLLVMAETARGHNKAGSRIEKSGCPLCVRSFTLIAAVVVIVKREKQPRRRVHAAAAHRAASLAAWTGQAIPPVLRRIHRAGAEIVNANPVDLEIIQVDIELARGRLERDSNRFILNVILRDHRPSDGRHAVDVDAGRTGGSRICRISCVAGDMVADDHIVIQIDRRGRRRSRCMIVHRDSRQAVVTNVVVIHHIAPGRGTGERSEDANARAGTWNLKAIVE